MLARYRFSDQTRFKAAFDADAEDRASNGLSLLQLWRDTGDQSSVWALYQIGNGAAARAYLQGAAAVFNSQAGVDLVETHWLETL